MPKVICPYKATNTKTCSHKGTKLNKAKKRRCGFKYPHNCELFVEWLEKSKKVSPAPSKMPKNYIQDDESDG